MQLCRMTHQSQQTIPVEPQTGHPQKYLLVLSFGLCHNLPCTRSKSAVAIDFPGGETCLSDKLCNTRTPTSGVYIAASTATTAASVKDSLPHTSSHDQYLAYSLLLLLMVSRNVYLVPLVHHEVKTKKLKAALPPQRVQFVSDSVEGMHRAGTHLGH